MTLALADRPPEGARERRGRVLFDGEILRWRATTLDHAPARVHKGETGRCGPTSVLGSIVNDVVVGGIAKFVVSHVSRATAVAPSGVGKSDGAAGHAAGDGL